MNIADHSRITLLGTAAGLLAFGGLLAGPVNADPVDPPARLESAVALDDDPDDLDDDNDDTDGNTHDSMDNSAAVSNDATNSRVTSVTRNGDQSIDGLTRDLTNDGPGGPVRDWSDNRTNDASVGDTRASRQTNDNTASNYSQVSRDRDRSRGDLTRDLTRDGGDLTRDVTSDSTNDRSRNDTR